MTFKKIISVFLISIALLSLSACTPEDADNPPESSAETEAVAEAELLVLLDNGATDFKIVRAEGAKGFQLDTAVAVNNRMRTTLSRDFKIIDDWMNPNGPAVNTDHEILLFETNRPETAAALEDLDFEGYIIRVTDSKIVIVGASPAACSEALFHFIDRLIPEYTKDGVTAFPVGLEVRGEFKPSDLDVYAALREGRNICADYNVVFKYSQKDDFDAAQGAATDGKYAYVIMKKNVSGVETDRVIKVDMETWSVVLESDEMPLDHANDMTYDPVKKQLVVVNMLDNLVSIIDPETLTLTEQKQLPYGTWGVGYIDGAGQYAFLAYGSPSGLVITDGAFNPIRSSALADTTGYVGQGMDADAEYAYVPLSPQSGTKDNIIQIFEIKTGKYIGKITVNTLMESESMFHVGDDFYLHFNNQGSKIATLEFYEKFE